MLMIVPKNHENRALVNQMSLQQLSEDKNIINLELKPYIQPFERILAWSELAGLIEPDLIKDAFEKEAKETASITTQTSIDTLSHRLAYWQRIGNKIVMPTFQVLYESSQENIYGKLLDKNKLPNKRLLRYGPHDIHEYRGKFFPQLVKSLINSARTPAAGIVIDPMCGSGTTNCEARSMGMKTIGMDYNPLSVKIAFTKTAILEVDPSLLGAEIEIIINNVNKVSPDNIDRRWSQSDLAYLKRWFSSQALYEIAQILEYIDNSQNPIIKSWVQLCLSNVFRDISWQKNSDLRVRKEVTEYEDGTALYRFLNELTRQRDKIIPYLNILAGNCRLQPFDIREGDARIIDQIMDSWLGECDVLITSPPYATALPYIDTDRLSLVLLGLLPRREHRPREFSMIGNREISESQRLELWDLYIERRKILPEEVCSLIDSLGKTNHSDNVGFRRRNLPALLAKYFLDMTDILISTNKMLKPNRLAFFIVGNNSTYVNDFKLEIPTNKFLWQIGKKVGWNQERLINMELLPSRDIFRNNRGSSETILVFRS